MAGKAGWTTVGACRAWMPAAVEMHGRTSLISQSQNLRACAAWARRGTRGHPALGSDGLQWVGSWRLSVQHSGGFEVPVFRMRATEQQLHAVISSIAFPEKVRIL
eukprot:1158236-Pelagomonas_calceolata.AAC.6